MDRGDANLWAGWWDYNGISGPQFWGFINPGWNVCSKGRNQSPIDIDPSSLLFDPALSPLSFVGESGREDAEIRARPGLPDRDGRKLRSEQGLDCLTGTGGR
ncbi:hypothetical protein ACOMHN_015851 [Nucella lapillus]